MVEILGEAWMRAREPAERVERSIPDADAGVEEEKRGGERDDAVGREHADDDRRRILEYGGREGDRAREEKEAARRAAGEAGDEGEHTSGYPQCIRCRLIESLHLRAGARARILDRMKRTGVALILVFSFFGLADSAYLAQHARSGAPLICDIQNFSG